MSEAQSHPSSSAALSESESSYTRETLADGYTRYTVHPARGPRPLLILWLVLAAVPWLFWMQMPARAALTPYFFIASGILLLVYLARWGRLSNLSMNRQPGGAFDVNGQGIRLAGGRVIPRFDIARLLYRNSFDGNSPLPMVMVTHGSLAGFQSATQAAGNARRMEDYRAFQAIAFRLEVESMGKAIILAGGMTEATVYAIFSEASATLGLTSRHSVM